MWSFQMHPPPLPFVSDWDIEGKWEKWGDMRLCQTGGKKRRADTSGISFTELSFHWGGSQESCAGWLRLGHIAEDRQSDCLRCHSLGKEQGSGAGGDLRWSQNQPLGDTDRGGSVLWASPLRPVEAAELGGRGETEQEEGFHFNCEPLSEFSSKLQGVITSHPVCLSPPPSSQSRAPGRPTTSQLPVLTAESLSVSWAMCHRQGNNKEQSLKHRDTCCTLRIIYHYFSFSHLLYLTIAGYAEEFRALREWKVDGFGGIPSFLMGVFAAVTWTYTDGVTGALNKWAS